ncbi:MAG: prepilin-type N-terminal cleavage/methylation domain-containing protein [Capsulimonadales bacterium]|nr:prepilin-type N-terminal cleavage/methylation domain-containing protein [Capsulimonadales bacterium]
MNRKAFTLIELLVVIAIIAILAAILFPVFAKARDKARQTTDLSNMKQIVLGAMMYVQDYDEVLPSPAFRTCGQAQFGADEARPFGGPIWSRNWRVWPEVIYPYVKNTQLFTSPNRADWPFYGFSINVNSSNDDYPQAYNATDNTGGGTPPGNWNDGRCSSGLPVVRPEQRSVSMAEAQTPANTIWFHNSNTTVYQEGFNTWAGMLAFYQGLTGADVTDANELQVDGSESIGQLFLTGGSQVDNSTIIKEPHRYSNGMNLGFLDGHAKWMRPSAIKGEMWSLEGVPQGVE